MQVIDERIKEWATERQAEYIDAVNLHGSNQKAAAALGLGRRTVDQGIQAAKAAPPAIPSLPSEARHGPTPSICSPSCSAALMAERESWLRSLTDLAPPASHASDPTTR